MSAPAVTFPRARIAAITDKQWARLGPVFRVAGTVLNATEVQTRGGLPISAAYALLLGLFETGGVALFFLVYHCEAHPIGDPRPYALGTIPTPWYCEDCGRWVRNSSELRYELQGKVLAPVEFTA